MTNVIYPMTVSESIRTCGVDGSVVELLPSAAYSAAHVPQSHVIGFAFETQLGVHSFASDQRCDFYRQANSFAFIPSGCEVFSESAVGGEYLTLSLAPRWASEIDCKKPINQLLSVGSVQIARTLRKQLIADSVVDSSLVEQLANDIVQELTMHKQSVKYVLGLKQMKILDEFIDANIDQPLSVLHMAEVMHISAGHFSRVFKASVGVSPFDYVIQRRLAYARKCLRYPANDLSAIAFSSGFASHAHMTMAFKKYLGLTPSELRV
ncbi:MAG: AraC family transcriptional regulator [Candidatus Endobugula sp.]|jgi:AraC family transcriptional regulator